MKRFSLLVVAIVAGCSGAAQSPQSSFLPPATAAQPASDSPDSGMCSRPNGSNTPQLVGSIARLPIGSCIEPPSGKTDDSSSYVYVTNKTADGQSQMVVYRGFVSPAPYRIITKPLRDVGGITIDSNGHVFVANGTQSNVLEFAPGGSSVVRSFTSHLTNPVDVAVHGGTLYVSDRGSAANGYQQQIVEFSTATANVSAIAGVAGLGDGQTQNAGIALNSTSPANFYVTASNLGPVPFKREVCNGAAYTFGKNLFPTLWVNIPLAQNTQVAGIAFDKNGSLYAADPCANRVLVYGYQHYSWVYRRTVATNLAAPLYLTVNNDYLAIPSSGGTANDGRGYVTLINIKKPTNPIITFNTGLTHPIGAGVGPP